MDFDSIMRRFNPYHRSGIINLSLHVAILGNANKIIFIKRRYLVIPYIYKITNDINGKIYIGKTMNSIKERWKEHCNDYKKNDVKKDPYILR